MRHRVLLVDDEPTIRFGVRDFLEANGFEVEEAASLGEARTAFARHRPDISVLDHRLPDGSALELLGELRSSDPDVPVVVLTGHGSIDLAVRAMQEGAESFLTKPVELPALKLVLERALEGRRARRRQVAGQSRRAAETFNPFFGQSAAMRALSREAELALRSTGPVLIQGPTGSGKGVLARWLHENGPRRDEAMVDLNCAGLSRELVESELFGHARGAFTGAVSDKKGLLEVAHRGTLFLDEVGDLDPAVQPKLLKVLEEGRFRRLGEVVERQADVLLIAATNHDLARLVLEGRFRSDLYFRINTFVLAVPPLAERVDDIPALAGELLRHLRRDLARPGLRLADSACRALAAHSWPGNARELRNVLERASLKAEGDEIRCEHLELRAHGTLPATPGPLVTLRELERRQIERALGEERGRVVEAARRLGVPRSTLYQKIKEHAIDLTALQA